ncbi:MAG: Lrp/AsnC ligand binding domain-containing protein [Azospirillaceae bacterium]
MTDEIDRIDRRILAELRRDARITMTALAEKVGLTKTPAQARVKRLERLGVIRGYTARVDHTKLGAGHIAFVQVSLDDTRAAALDAFNAAVARLPEVEQAHMIAGSFDYLLKVRTADIAAYRRVLGEALSALPHVSHTSTFVVMEAVKEG